VAYSGKLGNRPGLRSLRIVAIRVSMVSYRECVLIM
jgi:hypothetical protein